MLFSFLKYMQPTSYLMMQDKNGNTVFPSLASESQNKLSHLVEDSGFSNATAKKYDLSWQAYKKGYLATNERIKEVEPLSVYDNYYFLRKYFKSHWGYYVLLIRILGFKNPLKQVKAFLKARQAMPTALFDKVFNAKINQSFKSELVKERPLISVVIPTLNRYTYLKDVLGDFEKQTYNNFEIVIVDQSDNFDVEFYEQFNLNLNVVHQAEKALWLARNSAIKAAKGKFIAFSEDDVRVPANWLEAHLRCMDYFNADISAGVFYAQGHSIPKGKNFYAIAEQFATGNAMVSASLFENIGLFDRQFEKGRMGDGAFGLRCFLAGYKSIANPEAYCVDIKAPSGGLREFGAWDAFRTSKWFAPRPIPSVLYYFRTYYGNKLAKLSLLKTIPGSIFSYRFKKNKFLKLLSGLLSIVLLPLIVFQVLKSWRISSKMLKEGPKIEGL